MGGDDDTCADMLTPQLLQDQIVLQGQRIYGNQWSLLSKFMPGRTQTKVRDRWKALNHKALKQKQKMTQPVESKGQFSDKNTVGDTFTAGVELNEEQAAAKVAAAKVLATAAIVMAAAEPEAREEVYEKFMQQQQHPNCQHNKIGKFVRCSSTTTSSTRPGSMVASSPHWQAQNQKEIRPQKGIKRAAGHIIPHSTALKRSRELDSSKINVPCVGNTNAKQNSVCSNSSNPQIKLHSTPPSIVSSPSALSSQPQICNAASSAQLQTHTLQPMFNVSSTEALQLSIASSMRILAEPTESISHTETASSTSTSTETFGMSNSLLIDDMLSINRVHETATSPADGSTSCILPSSNSYNEEAALSSHIAPQGSRESLQSVVEVDGLTSQHDQPEPARFSSTNSLRNASMWQYFSPWGHLYTDNELEDMENSADLSPFPW